MHSYREEGKGKEERKKKLKFLGFLLSFRFWICSGLRPDAEFGNPLWGGIINNTTKPGIWLVVMDGDPDLHYVPAQDHVPFLSAPKYNLFGFNMYFRWYPVGESRQHIIYLD